MIKVKEALTQAIEVGGSCVCLVEEQEESLELEADVQDYYIMTPLSVL